MKIVYRLDGELHEAARVEDVPAAIDHLISFMPDYPVDPHSEADHARIALYSTVLAELMLREK